MSFAEDVKNEAAHYETNDINSRRAELAALYVWAERFCTVVTVTSAWNSVQPIMPLPAAFSQVGDLSRRSLPK